ncbi:MAG: 3-deoxy-manno-octulosonate cytidylyltransferase [Bdellovibrionota bacterium]
MGRPVVIVIPARYASSRFPGKPLVEIHGKPMIQWVYERAKQVRGVARVIVATDDERIQSAVRKFGGEVMMTSPELASGTDRVAAVADQVEAEVYVNVQGDEPLLDPRAIEKAIELVTSGKFGLGTLMSPIVDVKELHELSVTKVVADRTGRAIYFSKFPIPYSRTPAQEAPFACQRHLGVYVFDRETLMRFRSLPPSKLEKGEMLEQLRALEDGIPIGIVQVDYTAIGVDMPEDLEKVRRLLV